MSVVGYAVVLYLVIGLAVLGFIIGEERRREDVAEYPPGDPSDAVLSVFIVIGWPLITWDILKDWWQK